MLFTLILEGWSFDKPAFNMSGSWLRFHFMYYKWQSQCSHLRGFKQQMEQQWQEIWWFLMVHIPWRILCIMIDRWYSITIIIDNHDIPVYNSNRLIYIYINTSSTRTRRGGSCHRDLCIYIYIRPFSSIELACAVRQRSPCVHAFFESGVLFHMSHLKLHFALHASHSTLHTPHFTLHTPHFTLHASQCTLHTSHSTLHTSHFTVHTSHFTLHTSHFTLHTSHFTVHTSHFTLHTSHFTLHTSHFTVHTSHFTLHTSHCTLHAPHFTLHTSSHLSSSHLIPAHLFSSHLF